MLQQVILDLTRRIRGIEGEIQHCQRDHEDRIRDQSKVIGNLQGDLDSVKKAIHDRGDEGIHVYEQIQAVKRQIDEKCTDIVHTSTDLEGVRSHNEQLRREIEQLHHETNHGHEVRKRQQQSQFNTKNELRTREKDGDEQRLRIQVLEKEERNLQERIRGLNDGVENRNVNIDKTNGKLDIVLRDCDQVKSAV